MFRLGAWLRSFRRERWFWIRLYRLKSYNWDIWITKYLGDLFNDAFLDLRFESKIHFRIINKFDWINFYNFYFIWISVNIITLGDKLLSDIKFHFCWIVFKYFIFDFIIYYLLLSYQIYYGNPVHNFQRNENIFIRISYINFILLLRKSSFNASFILWTLIREAELYRGRLEAKLNPRLDLSLRLKFF